MERKLQRAHKDYSMKFPPAIWNCCKRLCFSRMAADSGSFLQFDELLRIHEAAEELHRRVEASSDSIQERGHGIGGSGLAHCSATRTEKEEESDVLSTDRKEALRDLERFVAEFLPFFYGMRDAPSGTHKLENKLCTDAICYLLSISKNYLYARKSKPRSWNSDSMRLTCLVDSEGLRMRQLRRTENRGEYPPISELPRYQCGCEETCFSAVSIGRLICLYKEFAAISIETKPRRKENQYLMNVMFNDLTNFPVKTCNKALSALYTVSVAVIADIRRVLEAMCADPSQDDRKVLLTGVDVYSKAPVHPANRYSDEIREKVETHLDMTLRADPGASDGVQVYRVYSPEINTYEKLRHSIAKYLQQDENVDVKLSSSTLHRMINDYLHSRGSKITFLQSDLNACPTCKTLQYVLLQCSYDIKALRVRVNAVQDEIERNARPEQRQERQEELDLLKKELEVKMYQESTSLEELENHILRDAEIRQWLKKV